MAPIVVLTGFMGAGKTSVARKLAKRLGWEAIDLDDEIEAHAGRAISTIFETDGEEKFRELETLALRRVLKRQRVIVATGGGVLGREDNRRLLAGHQVVNLNAPFALLMARLEGSEEVRPLLRGGPGTLQALFEARSPFYAAVERQVDTAGKTPGQVAKEILRRHLDPETIGEESR